MSRTTGKRSGSQNKKKGNAGRQGRGGSGKGLGGQAQMTKKPQVTYGPVQVTQPKPTISNPREQAARDVQLGFEPQLDAIDQGIRDTQNLGQQRQTAVGDVYARLKNEVSGFGNTGDEYQQLAGQMQGFMGQLPTMGQPGGSFGPVLPEAQASSGASQALTGSVGQAAQAGLAMQRGQSIGDIQHMKTTFAGDMASRRTNYLEQMYDTIQQLQEGRLDLLEDSDELTKQRIDELRGQQFDQSLAAGQFGMNLSQVGADDKWRKQLMEMLQGELGGKRNRSGSPRSRGVDPNTGGPVHKDEGTTAPGGGLGPPTPPKVLIQREREANKNLRAGYGRLADQYNEALAAGDYERADEIHAVMEKNEAARKENRQDVRQIRRKNDMPKKGRTRGKRDKRSGR